MPKEFAAEFDVAVVGSGIAGLSAALAAAEMGNRVILLEKAKKLGGGTCLSYGGFWIGNNHLAEQDGEADDLQQVSSYIRYMAGGYAEEAKMQAYVDRAPEALRFFEECGIRLHVTRGLTDHYWGVAPGARAAGRHLDPDLTSIRALGAWQDRIFIPRDQPTEMTLEEVIQWGGITDPTNWNWDLIRQRREQGILGRGTAVVVHFVRELLARNVELRVDAAVARLSTFEQRIDGVELEGGEAIRARKGVVLATGGYDSNHQMAEHIEGLPGWLTQFPDTLTGDHLVMAGERGAQTRTIHNNFSVFLGFHVPKVHPDDNILFRQASICEMLCPHTIVVNRDGRRFGDEAYFQDLVPRLREYDMNKRRHVNLPCFLIFDQQYVDAFSFAYRPAGAPIPDWVARADTLAGLGRLLGVEERGLEATVERFNGFARKGVDEDFNRGAASWTLASSDPWKEKGEDREHPNPRLGTLRVPPFFGIELHPSCFVSHGLLTEANAQVLHHRGSPIPGLYAVGNAAAHTEYGIGYQAGFSLGSALTFGYLAARHIAAQRPNYAENLACPPISERNVSAD